ncbi:MAG: glycosyltransferase family 39 protein [bacterium]
MKNIIIAIILGWGGFVFFKFINNHQSFISDFNFLLSVLKPIFLLLPFIFLSYSLGFLFFKLLGLKFSPIEDFVFRTGFGFGGFGIIGLILGGISLLNLKSLFFISIFVLTSSFIVFLKGDKKPLKIKPLKKDETQGPMALWFFIGLFLLLYLLATLTPAISWDGATYHLTIPKLYLEKGKIFFIERNIYSNMPLLTEMIFMEALMIDGIVLAKLIHFTFGMLILFGIMGLSQRFFSKEAGAIGCFLLLICPVISFEIKIEYIDLALAFFSFLSLYSFLLWVLLKNKKLLILIGVFSGFAIGCKYTGAIFPFILSLMIALELVRTKRTKEILSSLTILFFFCFLLFSPWILKNIILVKDPFYPMLYSIFKGPEWQSEFSLKWKAFFYSLGMGRSLENYLKLPYNMVIYGDMYHARFDGIIEPSWLILIPSLFFLKPNPNILYLLFYCFIFLIFWAFTTQQMRFFIPALPILSLISGYIISSLGKGKWLLVYPLIVMGIFIQSSTILSILRDDLPVLVGKEPKEQYLTRTHQPYAMFQYINKNIKKDAKLLFVWENRGFFCEKRYIADSLFEVSWIMKMAREAKDTKGLSERLKEMGITHILINRGLQSIFMREEGMEIIDRFIKEKTKPIYSIYYIDLYEILP